MSIFQKIAQESIQGNNINKYMNLLINTSEYIELFSGANVIRQHFKGNTVSLCSIVNAKSGRCPEDCKFCGQSSHFETASPTYKLQDMDTLRKEIHIAEDNGATEFSFVASGRKINKKEELHQLGEAIHYTKHNTHLEACSSLGLMEKTDLEYLKNQGMDHFHHNLETSRSFFPNIVTTHSYDDELQAVKNAQEVGLRTCCGGIFGMGERWEQRIELAFELKDLNVDNIPINFLNPIPGTPLANQKLLEPYEALKIVALYRYIMPEKTIMVMGGRERVLGDMQSWIFFAGANGMLLGNYLITKGRSAKDDLKMIEDLGMRIRRCGYSV